MKICLRCGQDSKLSSIGEALINFVCDNCRLDNGQWHWGDDVTPRDMERLSIVVLDTRGVVIMDGQQ